MCARFIALLGVLLALSGCSGGHRGETLPGGTSVHTIAFGGLDRMLHVLERQTTGPLVAVHMPSPLA